MSEKKVTSFDMLEWTAKRIFWKCYVCLEDYERDELSSVMDVIFARHKGEEIKVKDFLDEANEVWCNGEY